MKLLSKELVSLEYRDQLRQDLARAAVCRFLVAYVSNEGIDGLGRHLLTRALGDPRSFGVSSMSCSCGYEPLLRLQQELDISIGPRLKYFMDPLVAEPDKPSDLTLLHSKLVYLALERDRKSVVYIGSHNWTRRALGTYRPRNAEVSLRLEMEWEPEHLDGTGPSLASEVNRHLLQAYALPECMTATPDHEDAFRRWYEKGCGPGAQAPLGDATIVLAVRKPNGTPVAPTQWQGLTGRGVYLQALEEAEGLKLWRSNGRILVLVWNAQADLRAGRQPIILRCRITTNNAGPGSTLGGTNQSASPIAGFQAVLFDEGQLAAAQGSSRPRRSSMAIWSGRSVELFDFEFPTNRLDSSQVDGKVTPKYQFNLTVEYVAFPAEGDLPDEPEMVWDRATFAVAKSRESAKYVQMEGYRVSRELEEAIRRSLAETFLVDLETAKVLPTSKYDEARAGRRVSNHPLHETFLGETLTQNRIEFYQRAAPGTLVADIDEPARTVDGPRLAASFAQPVQRIQRVFTTPLDALQATWAAAAAQFRSRNRQSNGS